MRVAINGSVIIAENGAGNKSYLVNLVRALSKQVSGDDELHVFASEGTLASIGRRHGVVAHPLPIDNRRPAMRCVWEQLIFPLTSRAFDLIHQPGNSIALFSGVPTMVTIHDLSYRFYEENYPGIEPWERLHYVRCMLSLAAQKARIVATVSDFSRREIVNTLSVSSAKVARVYNGYDEESFYPESAHLTAEFQSSQGPYILCVGGKGGHKNQHTLVQAFSMFRRKTSLPHRLVLLGNRGRGYAHVAREIAKSGFRDEILDMPYASNADLRMWYSAADMFVFPSLYEGFGIPVLEAMACGCPVVASNRASLPEVVGNAGILVDCAHPEALADAIIAIAEDRALRSDLVERGFSRCKLFSWERAARETWSLYRLAAGPKAESANGIRINAA